MTLAIPSLLRYCANMILTFEGNVHISLRMNCNPLMFHLAPSSVQIIICPMLQCMTKYQQNYHKPSLHFVF